MNHLPLSRRSSDSMVQLQLDVIQTRRKLSSSLSNIPEYEVTTFKKIRRPSESDELYRQAIHGAQSKRLERRNSFEPRPISEKSEKVKLSKRQSLQPKGSVDCELPTIRHAMSMSLYVSGMASNEDMRELESYKYMVDDETKGDYLTRHSISLSETHFPTLGSGALTNDKRMSLEDIRKLEKDLKRTMI